MGRATGNAFQSKWTRQHQQIFMNHVWHALGTGQKINYRFATDLQKSLNYPSGLNSVQTRILRTARRSQKLSNAFWRRSNNIDRLDRVIAQREERIRVLKARERAKEIGGLSEYRAAKKLSNANKASVQQIGKDTRKLERLDGRIVRCHKKIEDLNTKAHQSL